MLRRWAIACIAVAALSGCNGSGLPNASAIAQLQRTERAHAVRSWMAPDAAKADLLYVSDFETNDVSAYSFPEGKLVGKLSGILKHFIYPTGLCADKSGNLYVPDSANSKVLEYAHGATKPLRMLSDPDEYPYSCAVDPATGDLAVVNLESVSGAGGVSLYKHADGHPVKFTYGFVYKFYFDAYDGKGNLFIDASYQVPSQPFTFTELPRGAKSLRPVTLNNDFDIGGGVAWDGEHVDVADSSVSKVYRFSIPRKTGKLAGTTPLQTCRFVTQFFVADKTIVAASFHGKSVTFWKYPAGGAPVKRIGGFGEPFGVTLSRAAAHT
jgi:hypothetical protein